MFRALLAGVAYVVLLVLAFGLFAAGFANQPCGGGYAIAGAIVLGYLLLPITVDRCRRP